MKLRLISPFAALLFPERRENCTNNKKYVPFIEIVSYLTVLFISSSLGLEIEILFWKTEHSNKSAVIDDNQIETD